MTYNQHKALHLVSCALIIPALFIVYTAIACYFGVVTSDPAGIR